MRILSCSAVIPFLLSALWLPRTAASLGSASDSGYFYLHLDTPNHQAGGSSKEISLSQATSVLSHNLAISHLVHSPLHNADQDLRDLALNDDAITQSAFHHLFNQPPNAHLLLSVLGTSSDIDRRSTFKVDVSAPTSADTFYSFVDELVELYASSYGDSSNIVSISSESRSLAIPRVTRVNLGQKRSMVKAPQAAHVLANEISKLANQIEAEELSSVDEHTVFDATKEVDRDFLFELDFNTQFLQKVPQEAFVDFGPQKMPDLISISFSKLNAVATEYGTGSKQYTTAVALVHKAVSKIENQFRSRYHDLATVEILYIPQSLIAGDAKSTETWSRLSRRAPQIDPNCLTSVSSCQTYFNNCSNHGACTSVQKGAKTCFVCSCWRNNTDDNGAAIPGFTKPVKWAGPYCAVQDVSVDFQLVFWTSVTLAVILVFAVGGVYSLNDGDNGPGVGPSSRRAKTD
ncbi:uncharacterized protein BJ171DRAFT_509645 [Polychytrium aggregatum]|uniref:uncharacterized protein n=1 Tax=Polychytrium aggregatum TaxID=110093 RepID=UPI0022FE627E|nr:uncharacterized protein BJ171DRAFT_509645 [Polychytrium aggregatum]KAI9203425.1 hypothetical protein BJ171DRAFT_509645 [Polychytrium aggregatum]